MLSFATRLATVQHWFDRQGWEIFPFQEEVWTAYTNGESGLIHSATGTGKTLAAWLGPVLTHAEPTDLTVLWITPLRALAADTAESLARPVREMDLPWRVELRTGDTTSSTKTKQMRDRPHALVTTPESLMLMLGRVDAPEVFQHLRCVVVDEWHELMGTKRGVQTELGLARLRRLSPGLLTWGISATLGNTQTAAEVLVGPADAPAAKLVRGYRDKEIVIDTILPENLNRFPWAGHFGTQMIPPVVKAIEESESCLVFTNTRAMSEIWYQQICDLKPEWRDVIGLHHGSLDREVRDEVELGLKTGRLRAVVCTSSLDLGVDFSPVDRVIQIGSPKGVARLLQRAGRSGHRPGVASRITCVPTHAFELVDLTAARVAAVASEIESRPLIFAPLDVLAQHLVTIALGTGFRAEELRAEVQTTHAYHQLGDDEWQWALDFVVRGGDSLRAYPEFRRVSEGPDGVYRVADKDIALRHRLSIGTIVSDAAMAVRYVGGGMLGTVEESFLSRLSPGDKFLFAGKALEFVRIKDMTAWVKRATSVKGAVPRWAGGRLPLSSELSYAIRRELDYAAQGELRSPEMETLQPVLEVQARWSAIPEMGDLLIETLTDREGCHWFLYPFEGRLVHEGLAALFAYRIARERPTTFSVACNDYGFELLSPDPIDLEPFLADCMSPRYLAEDILASLNSVEMAKRQFREVARIAGLVFQGYPGVSKSAKQLQASSGLFFDVFARYDPQNRLLEQSQREVLDRQLEQSRMAQALDRLRKSRIRITNPPRPTPMSFPILVDRLRETLSTESVSTHIERLAEELERAANT